jgi:hypothetical protein
VCVEWRLRTPLVHDWVIRRVTTKHWLGGGVSYCVAVLAASCDSRGSPWVVGRGLAAQLL